MSKAPRTVSTAAPDVTEALPHVARSASTRGWWWFAGGTGLAALLLFNTLEARRTGPSAPTVRARVSDLAAVPAPPPTLFIPPERQVATVQQPVERLAPTPRSSFPSSPRYVDPPAYVPPSPAPQAVQATQATQEQTPGTSALVVVGQGRGAIQAGAPAFAPPSAPTLASSAAGIAVPGKIDRPPLTIAQGTIVSAVLETGLDSTRPGQARALVAREVRSFDGTTVLIPRGARLYGLYQSDVAPGQRRVLIQWSRLLLPDGDSIALDSPVSDPQGRAGVEGNVNSHFLRRFSGAILRSVLDIGVRLATQRVNNGSVVVALPGATTTIGGGLIGADIPPTITVKPGARVSIFVARDLAFSKPGRAQ